MIYLIADEALTVCKIGTTKDIRQRLAMLQTGFPSKLHLHADRHGDSKLERKIHRQLAEYRLEGEWFRFCPDVVQVFQKFNDGRSKTPNGNYVFDDVRDVLYDMMNTRDPDCCDYDYWTGEVLRMLRDSGREYSLAADYVLWRHQQNPINNESPAIVAWKAMLDQALGETVR